MNKHITVSGVNIPLRHVNCVSTHPNKVAAPRDETPSLGLTVYLTNACNATCKFCSNLGDDKPFKFDFEKFKDVWDEMTSKCKISLVSFTGGEPTLNMKDFIKCADYIQETCPTPMSIMTNGVLLHKLDHPGLVQISISRHHWNHEDNERILGFKLKKDYLKVPNNHKLKIACNIIKGEVDTPAKMKKVLNLAAEYDIPQVGFVGLMPINDYTDEFGMEVPKLEGKGLITYESWQQNEICSCARSLYTAPNGKLIRFYYRHNKNFSFNQGGLAVFKYNKLQTWY